MASEKSQAQAVQYEREDTWSRIKGKTGKRVVGAIATATAAASMVLPLSACGEQSSGGGYNVPAASTEATPEHWTLDEVAFDEYMASLPSKAEQAEASKIPLGLSDAELGQAVTDRICSAINFGAEPELRDIFNQGEINNDLDKSLREAEIEKRATEVAEKNGIFESILKDTLPGVTTYEDTYPEILRVINKNSIGKYIYDQDSELSMCTPVAVFAGNNMKGSGRIVNLLYNNEGGMNKTKLKDGVIDFPGIASGDSYIAFSTNETGDSTLITGIAEYPMVDSASPAEWHFY